MADSELESWREAHKHLTHAVLAAQEGVAIAKAQRRYWMEEICANLTVEGKLANTSVWKKVKATRKPAARRKAIEKPAAAKRRRKTDETLTDDEDSKPAKRTTKKKRKADEEGGTKGKKPKVSAVQEKPRGKQLRTPEEPIVEVYPDEDDSEEQSDHAAAMPLEHETHAPPFMAASGNYGPPTGKQLPMHAMNPYSRMIHPAGGHEHYMPYPPPPPGVPPPGMPGVPPPPPAVFAPTAYPNAYASVWQRDSDDSDSTNSSVG